jgi:monoamine oxidase
MTPFYHAARISADFMVAAPFAALSHVRFGTHVLDSDKLRAIRTLHYENATKIILEFSQRFWDEEGDLTPIKGGRSVTDLPIRWVLYPPRRQLIPGSRRGVLLASYTLGEDGSRWTSLSSQDRIWFALRTSSSHLISRCRQHSHFPAAIIDYEKRLVCGISHSWAQDEYSFGGFFCLVRIRNRPFSIHF